MRNLLLAGTCLVVLAVCAFLGARTADDSAKVRLRLVDGKSGEPIGGIVRVFPAGKDKPLALSGLFDRLRGLERSQTVAGWYVVPAGGAETMLPRGRLRLEALSGLETGKTAQELDLTAAREQEVTVKLTPLFRPRQNDWVAGNTHLHLRNLTLAESDDYLRLIPPADGIKVMFISYLERHKDDATYITNQYPIGPLEKFASTGVLYDNGEEHRHNFQGYGQGYGHVMFLGIRELVKPVSLGPGITGAGFDDMTLRPGIDNARQQGGTIIWCHNTNGHEDVPSALTGRLDALNVFDGSRTGTFEDNYYRYLNIGLRLPISTGTDWFIYDFSRVYARVPGKLTVKSWLDAVKAGRCVATNSPLLTLTVDGRDIGDVLTIDKPRSVRVEATALGRHDFEKLQLLHNGKVINEQKAEPREGGFTARMTHAVAIDRPSWLAVRIESKTKNELDRQLYAHTSPVYVDFAGKRVFDVESARALLRQVEEGRAEIRARGKFSTPQAVERLLALYDEAAKDLTQRVNQRQP